MLITYGNRSNQFLLQNYGFTLLDNFYDSYTFNINMDIDPNKKFDMNNNTYENKE